MSTELAARECVPCRGGVPALEGAELEEFLRQLGAGWEVVDEHHLRKPFEFEDFVAAMEFANDVARLAEDQGHHPDMHVSWGRVVVEIWTHKIDGLTESDFILAAKIEEL